MIVFLVAESFNSKIGLSIFTVSVNFWITGTPCTSSFRQPITLPSSLTYTPVRSGTNLNVHTACLPLNSDPKPRP